MILAQNDGKTNNGFGGEAGFVLGEPWFSGDQMIFVQRNVPAVALTAERTPELTRTVTHTSKDTPEVVDSLKLVEIAGALASLCRRLAA